MNDPLLALGLFLIVLALCGTAYALEFYLDGKDSF